MATDSTSTLNGLLTTLEECPLSFPPLLSYSDDVHRECSDYGLVRTAMRCLLFIGSTMERKAHSHQRNKKRENHLFSRRNRFSR
ncbi:hypothetical protein CUMW_263260 [Citrus unshiu]|uniref:Uncharacterized protein n=1 Tax=Citrus unshiu TaxID=55188 RepID=A0A2H5QUT2_CITUN|nr:hypothetical protein CUMW_263260 [Citrus unshiu]